MIDPKTLTKAIEQARVLSARVREAYTKGSIRTFADIVAFGIELPNYTPEALAKPIQTGLQIDAIRNNYVLDTAGRLERAFANKATRRRLTLAKSDDVCYKFTKSSFKLYREQDPVYRSVTESLFGPSNARSALIPAGTGAGKTIISAAIVDWMIANKKHIPALPLPLPYPIQIYTVKNAVEQTKEKFAECGLGEYLDKIIFIWPYSCITSSFGLERLVEAFVVTDPHTDQESIMYQWRPLAVGVLNIYDECHSLAREDSQRTKAILAADEKSREFAFINTKNIFMSATPAEKVNDARVIVCLSDLKFQGTPITKANFSTAFANIIGGQDGPAVPSKASISRLYDAIAPIVHEPPYFPWPYKAINACKMLKFKYPEQVEYYDKAMGRYLERIQALGKDTPSDLAQRRIELLQLRKAAEPCRAEQMVDDMVAIVNQGKTALMGTAFTGTIIKAVFYLIDEYGLDRSLFSVVWGGRNPRPSKILTQAECIDLILQPNVDEKTMRLIKKNIEWNEDRLLFDETTSAEQDSRYSRLKELNLVGIQTQDRRQAEINKFKSGQARFIFFTMQSGGTGLSLEHADDRTAPRVGFYTPIYNGKEFVQALGRAPRRNSISDTYQHVCLLEDTIEVEHVAPVLDNKLQSLGEGTTKKDDLYNILANLTAEELRKKTRAKIRTLAEAEAECRTSEATQLHAGDSAEEDEDDE